MELRTIMIDVYRNSDRCLLLVGSGLRLAVRNVVGYVQYETSDGRLSIDGNETVARVCDPFEFETVGSDNEPTDVERIMSDASIQLLVNDGSIEYIVGHYENLPYGPYYGVTEDGVLYEVEDDIAAGDREADELLDIEPPESYQTVRNVQSGWALPIEHDTVKEWFESGTLRAAIEVRE